MLSRGIRGEKMGRAFSVHTFAGFIGGAAAPPALLTATAFGGVPLAFAFSGTIALVVALLLAAVPADAATTTSARTTKTAGVPSVGGLRGLLTPAVLSLMLLYVLLSLCTSGIQNFSVSAFTKGFGISLPLANAALTGFLLASAAGVLTGGILADRTRRHGVVASLALLLSGALVSLVALVALPQLLLVAVMTAAGFLFGMIAPSRDMLVRAASPAGAEGRVFGIVSTGFNIAGLVGPMFYASLLDHGYYRGIFLAATTFMIITMAITLAQELRARRT
jgi:predicted MFS family arabinose efflux permease